MTAGVDCTMIENESRTAPGRCVLLGPLSLLALQKKTWSPLLVKQGHKLRTREKREFKRQIADEVCRYLRERCQGGSQPPPQVELTPVLESLQAISAGFAESVRA
jgi:hypothetical protein